MQLALSTWHEVENYLRTSRGIIIPIGSTEQHGPNGLIGTDHLDAEFVARGVGEEIGCLVTPTLTIGMSQHHLGFAGSITVRPSTLIALVGDVVISLKKHGFERFLFINGHGGNIATVTAAFDEIYAATSMRGPDDVIPSALQAGGLVAGAAFGGAGQRTVWRRERQPCHGVGGVACAALSSAGDQARTDVAEGSAQEHRLLRLRGLSPSLPRRAHRVRSLIVHAGARRTNLSGRGC